EGKDLFRQRGCIGCHRYAGYDTEPEDMASVNQQIKQSEQQKKQNLKEAAEYTKQADQASDNAEANRLYTRAEALKVENSKMHGKELFETRGCLACHSIGEGDDKQGGSFAANLTRVGEKVNYDYLVRWVHDPRQRTRPYCPYEKKDIGPEDYARHSLPYQFDFE